MILFWSVALFLNAVGLYGALHSSDVVWAAAAGACTAMTADALCVAILRRLSA